MTEINFGISSYSRFSPGVPWEERIMRIPAGEKLSENPYSWRDYSNYQKANIVVFDLPNYSNVRENIFTVLSAVLFELVPDHSHSLYHMYLIWIEERGEWVAVRHHNWAESNLYSDEFEYGPYTLDDFCRKMLAKAYGVAEERLVGRDVSEINPVELEKLANKEL